jgi:hypothetical protein
MTEPPRAPRGLDKPGKALWRDIRQTFDFEDEPHVIAILEQAWRVADQIAALDAEIVGQPLTVTGSKFQTVINPLVSEARFQRKTLAELLSRLGLPDNSDPDDPQARRRAAGKAGAAARWKNRGY